MVENKITTSTVAVVRCRSYEKNEIRQAVKRGIALLGGTNRFAEMKERILLKPNVLWPTDPVKCVITHPMLLWAIADVMLATGARFSYGDSSAGFSKSKTAMQRCGYGELLEPLGVNVQIFNNNREVVLSDSVSGKRLMLAEEVLAADGIINVPKLKSHGLTRLTGAVKNLYGCVVGMTKGDYHARFPDPYDFSNLLVDIAKVVRPRLHIMDAVDAMEGNGPQSGTPKRLGVLLFSTDPVALDTIACKLINLPTEYVPTIPAGVKAGLGCGDAPRITLVGDPLSAFIDRSFKVVRIPPPKLPQKGILASIRRYFLPRPVIRRNRCIKCGRCVSVCPVDPKAMEQVSKGRLPEYDYRRCIRCYCCHEVCPEKAILIKEPLTRKLLPFAPYISLLVTNIINKRNTRNAQ
ncbi:MAG: DUF362 domain-containing protein [Candidatus Pacearchaeota archaeon]|nr:DUF362 domain-containing protein [Candidatus Pacearchaeota archaeon]